MAIRMTGLISGMDTESIVKQLMDAQRMKNKKTTDKQSLLATKQEKWKELNAKLFKLYSEDISKMRLQGNYQAKKVTSSDEDLISVTGGINAPEGSHSITVENLASSQYVTGGKIEKDGLGNPITATASTKLTDLGISAETLINFTNGDTTKTLEVTSSTTIAEFVNKAKEAGLNASFDETQKRFFISSKASGLDNIFQITATTSTATAPKNQILDAIGYSTLSSVDKKSADTAIAVLGDSVSVAADITIATNTLATLAQNKVLKQIQSDVDAEIRSEVTPIAKLAEENAIKSEVMQEQLLALQETYPGVTEATLTPDQKATITTLQDAKVTSSTERINAAVELKVKQAITTEQAITPDNRYTQAAIDRNAEVVAADTSVRNLAVTYRTNSQVVMGDANALLNNLGIDALNADGTKVNPASTLSTLIAAADSKIIFNGAELTGSSNVITANGLTMTLKGLTAGKTINLNVANNTQETYDMVKNFVKNYNAILKEMNNLYDAPSARGYDPLSDDERESMTDDQIEKWETKIKDSILRRDSTVGSLATAMRTSLGTSVEVEGKRYSLASYGIQTSFDYTENGLLHIYGDADDSTYSANEDKLMKALEEDPDTVMQVLSGITKNLYDTMSEKMSAIPNLRSVYTFYNDKEMDKTQTQYKKQISILEEKLTAMEDRYYKQFTAMETAMAKMQSQSNALAGMMGTSNQ